LAQLLREEKSDPGVNTDAPLLTVRERETLDYLLWWGWDINLWDRECERLAVKLGVRTEKQIEDARVSVRPRRRRAR
jgi:hypothetical protein